MDLNKIKETADIEREYNELFQQYQKKSLFFRNQEIEKIQNDFTAFFKKDGFETSKSNNTINAIYKDAKFSLIFEPLNPTHTSFPIYGEVETNERKSFSLCVSIKRATPIEIKVVKNSQPPSAIDNKKSSIAYFKEFLSEEYAPAFSFGAKNKNIKENYKEFSSMTDFLEKIE